MRLIIQICNSEMARVQPFDIEELKTGLRKLVFNKCGDEHGIVTEMLKSGSDSLHDCILRCFIEMLSTSSFPQDWHRMIFKMLPKTGDSSNVDKWQPIAILQILYGLFTQLLFAHILLILHQHQDQSQLGFRLSMRLENAFATIEKLVGNCDDHHIDWCVQI